MLKLEMHKVCLRLQKVKSIKKLIFSFK